MKTAVQWYSTEAMKLELERAKGNISISYMLRELINVLKKAKEMEKQQNKFFFDKGHLYSGCEHGFEECYNKNFNNEQSK